MGTSEHTRKRRARNREAVGHPKPRGRAPRGLDGRPFVWNFVCGRWDNPAVALISTPLWPAVPVSSTTLLIPSAWPPPFMATAEPEPEPAPAPTLAATASAAAAEEEEAAAAAEAEAAAAEEEAAAAALALAAEEEPAAGLADRLAGDDLGLLFVTHLLREDEGPGSVVGLRTVCMLAATCTSLRDQYMPQAHVARINYTHCAQLVEGHVMASRCGVCLEMPAAHELMIQPCNTCKLYAHDTCMRQAARAQCEQQRRCGGIRHGFACIWCGRTDSRLPPRQRQRTSTHSTRSGAQWLGTVTED